MKLVLDASVVVQPMIQDTYSSNAIRMFSQFQAGDVLAVPGMCTTECVNVLWKQVRFKGMLAAQAKTAITNLDALPLTQYSVSHIHTTALDIALRHQLAVYDSVYIASAKALGFPLVTVDQKQGTAASAEGVALKPVTDF